MSSPYDDPHRLVPALRRYRVLATIVGVLLVVLCLVGLPLHYAHTIDPSWFPVGSDGERLGDAISQYLGVAHGWLYMAFVLVAFHLSRRAALGPRVHRGDPGPGHGADRVLLGRAPRHPASA